MKYFVILLTVTVGLTFFPTGKLSAHVEKTLYLKGKVGKDVVAIKMLCYDELTTRYIYYFFSNSKMDRYLEGKWQDSSWNFATQEQHNNHLKPEDVFNISETKNGIWKGIWINSSGKKQSIVLEPLSHGDITSSYRKLPFVEELDPYEFFRISSIRFTKQQTEKVKNGLTRDWYMENESKISFFRFQATSKKINTDSINKTLLAFHLSLLQQYFTYHPQKLSTKAETHIMYVSNELISFQTLITTQFTTTTTQKRQLTTLDLKSGENISLEDLFWLDKDNAKEIASDSYKMYKYRQKIFASKIFSWLQELYPTRMNTDSCGINKAETWALPTWCLINKGLALSFQIFDTCDPLSWAIIPYTKLAPYTEKKYRLNSKK